MPLFVLVTLLFHCLAKNLKSLIPVDALMCQSAESDKKSFAFHLHAASVDMLHRFDPSQIPKSKKNTKESDASDTTQTMFPQGHETLPPSHVHF